MKVSHVLYKTNNLNEEYKEKKVKNDFLINLKEEIILDTLLLSNKIVVFEKINESISKGILLLNKFKEGFFLTRSKRIDPSHRVLTWKLLFPNQIKIPFLMTPFNTNPKPKNFVHPNKINRIKQISYCTEANIIPIINELCNDDRLQLSAGKGECKVTYE